MHTLVTGGAGFLGRHLVKALVRAGTPPRVLVRSPEDRTRLRDSGAACVAGDLRDADSLHGALQGVERVLHCAALLPGQGTDASLWQVNVAGTASLARAAAAAGVKRFVMISTDSVYGDADREGATETTPIDTRYHHEGDYPRTKHEAERRLIECHRAHGLPVVILRPCLIYGPGQSAAGDIFSRWAARDTHWLIGGGHARISLVFVEDMVQAVLLAARHPRAPGRCYNVSGPRAYSKREILEAIARWSGRPKRLLAVPARPLEAALRVAHPLVGRMAPASAQRFDPARVRFACSRHVTECTRARVELGYAPRVELAEGLARTLEWLAGAGDGTVTAARTDP